MCHTLALAATWWSQPRSHGCSRGCFRGRGRWQGCSPSTSASSLNLYVSANPVVVLQEGNARRKTSELGWPTTAHLRRRRIVIDVQDRLRGGGGGVRQRDQRDQYETEGTQSQQGALTACSELHRCVLSATPLRQGCCHRAAGVRAWRGRAASAIESSRSVLPKVHRSRASWSDCPADRNLAGPRDEGQIPLVFGGIAGRDRRQPFGLNCRYTLFLRFCKRGILKLESFF